MNRYSVRICHTNATDVGPFAVFVLREDDDGQPKTVAGTTGIKHEWRAEQIAAEFRAQFGIAEVPK